MISRQEASWVLLAQCGDREAIELLLSTVPSCSEPVTVRSIIGPQHADDVTQEVLLIVYLQAIEVGVRC